MLKGIDISKSYDTKSVLKDMNINVGKGSIYGLVGENGCGKSTLLKVLKGIYKPEKGGAFMEESNVYNNMDAKEKIFFMSEEQYCFRGYSVQNLAKYYSGFYKNFSWEKFEELEKEFKFGRKTNFNSLSKGQKKQAIFWIALSIQPDIMILDEPLDGLDPKIRSRIKYLLIQEVASRDMSILISSHNLIELEGLCDHIGIMDEGKLVVDSNMDDLRESLLKVQYVQTSEDEEIGYPNHRLLKREKSGRVTIDTIKGDKDEILSMFHKKNMVFFDSMHMTLEEIFIAELEDKDYEYEKIII